LLVYRNWRNLFTFESEEARDGYLLGRFVSIMLVIVVLFLIIFNWFDLLVHGLYFWISICFFSQISIYIVVSLFYSLYNGMYEGAKFGYGVVVVTLVMVGGVSLVEFGLQRVIIQGLGYVLVMVWLVATGVSVGGKINEVYNAIRDYFNENKEST